jgi:hypothetical protein
MDDINKYRLPELARDNWEDWFRSLRLKCQAKDVFYTIEQTIEEYAWITNIKGASKTTGDPDLSDDISRLTSDFEKLGGTWHIDRKKEFIKDQATALMYIDSGLGKDDKPLIDLYESAKNVYTQLKKKYGKTHETTANKYIGLIQGFTFDETIGIDGCWAKLIEYRSKLIAANPAMRPVYTDTTLFTLFARKLPKMYKATTDGFRVVTSLTVEEKLQMLGDKEEETNEESESAHAAFHKKPTTRYIPPHRRNNSSGSESPIACFFCEGDHFIRQCPRIDLARQLLKQHDQEKEALYKETRQNTRNKHRSRPALKSDKKDDNKKKVSFSASSKSSNKKPSKKTRGFAANTDTSASDSSSGSESDSDTDDDVEECHISKDEISKVAPSTWPADTAASSHMSDQPDCFRSLTRIKKRKIQVGGGVMYAREKGTAVMKCQDGTQAILLDVLYVPGLGINLLSARRLYQKGLKGSFDENYMYFKDGKNIIVEAKMQNGLYVVSHINSPKAKKELAFVSNIDTTDEAIPGSQEVETDNKNDNPELCKNDKERYLLFHRRFSHCGPKKLRNLHKVTTLKKRIIVPTKREICEVCALTKIKNKFPKQLSLWQMSILGLIQFDVAGPFPTSIRGNRYFLLIIDSCTRKE